MGNGLISVLESLIHFLTAVVSTSFHLLTCVSSKIRWEIFFACKICAIPLFQYFSGIIDEIQGNRKVAEDILWFTWWKLNALAPINVHLKEEHSFNYFSQSALVELATPPSRDFNFGDLFCRAHFASLICSTYEVVGLPLFQYGLTLPR